MSERDAQPFDAQGLTQSARRWRTVLGFEKIVRR